MELVRGTEAAALAAGRWMGRGDKNAADGAAVDAMRLVLNTVSMDGVVVIGEGEKDEAPMLFNGEEIGDGGPACRHRRRPASTAPRSPSLGRHNAISVIARRRARHDVRPRPVRLHGQDRGRARGRRRRSTSTRRSRPTSKRSPRRSARTSTTSPRSILDRDRHDDIIRECREAGARIRLIQDGDVAGAISAAWPDSGADILFGIGGTPEGVIAACALKAIGGAMLRTPLAAQRRGAHAPRSTPATTSTACSHTDDLVSGDDVFFAATGITDGDLLKGVRYWGDGASTQSLVMRSKSGTIRTIDATHRWQKLMRYSAFKFD